MTVNIMPVYLTSRIVTLSFFLVASLTAIAENMPDNTYSFLKKNINVEFSAAKLRCASLSGIAFQRCIAEAKQSKKTSKTELDNAYKEPLIGKSSKRSTSADEDNMLAMHKCYTQADGRNVLCEKSAKFIRNKKIDNANIQMSLQRTGGLPNTSAMPIIEETLRPFNRSILI